MTSAQPSTRAPSQISKFEAGAAVTATVAVAVDAAAQAPLDLLDGVVDLVPGVAGGAVFGFGSEAGGVVGEFVGRPFRWREDLLFREAVTQLANLALQLAFAAIECVALVACEGQIGGRRGEAVTLAGEGQ